MSSASKNRRGAPRYTAALGAYLITPSGRPLRGVARNLSRSGVFMETRVPTEWLVGETAWLIFTVNDGNIVRLIRYSTVVVRESQHGFGLAFWRAIQPSRIQQALGM
jgi:hypothetical protein